MSTKSTKCSKKWVDEYVRSIEDQSTLFVQDTIFSPERKKTKLELQKEEEAFINSYKNDVLEWEKEFRRKKRRNNDY